MPRPPAVVRSFGWIVLLALAASPAVAVAAPPVKPDGVEVEKDLPYLGEGRAEKLDLYRPAAAPPAGTRRPAVVIIHGGGWTGGDKAADRELGIGYTVASAGWVGVSINYRLATKEKATWPGNLDDCRAAVRFLRANADKYAIDPDRIAAIGGSAGGHLSLMLGTRAAGAERVRAVVALYAPTDLTARAAVTMLGADATEELKRAASPIHQLTPDFPPVLLMHGTNDKTVPIESSRSMEAAMKKAKLDVKYVEVEGAPHTFPLQTAKHDLRPTFVEFLKSAFERKPAQGK
ncbi:MAG TPA: alpha/beta hydrolase [Humisphaera sp.]